MTRNRLGSIALGVATALAGVVAPAVPAAAADGRLGVRETVCADSLAVRTEPLGAWMGELEHPQTFLVEELHGNWVKGFAYGNVNRRGWVQNGWFC